MLKNFSHIDHSVVCLGLRTFNVSFGLFTEASFIRFLVLFILFSTRKKNSIVFHKNNLFISPLSSFVAGSPGKRSSKAVRRKYFNLEHSFATGNGEWTVRPDFYPVQPAFISVLPHRYSGFGLCWKDNCIIQAAVQ